MGQIPVFPGPERRRRWGDEQRQLILTEAYPTGARATEVARRHEISTGQLCTWRSKLVLGAAAPSSDDGRTSDCAETLVINSGVSALSNSGVAIAVDLPRGRRVTIFGSASRALTAAALKALGVISPDARIWFEMGYTDMRAGAELLFETFSQRYERGPTIVTLNLLFEEWTSVLGSGRLTGALLDRLTHHVSILAMKSNYYRPKESAGRRRAAASQAGADQNHATDGDPETSEITDG